jgi:two-component system, OmpR family, sensor kinase
MRSRLRNRAMVAVLAVGLLAALWYALSVAFLPEPPVPREILIGAAGICLILFAVIGGLAIIETRALRLAGERMRRFLADASHELRTPIAGVQASAETLLRASLGPAAREELVVRILRETYRAGRLVDDLLTITRLEQGAPLVMELFDLASLTDAAVGRTRELAPGVSVELDAPGRSLLHGDPRRIGQILDNVLSNARHATPAGGRITVRVTHHAAEIQVEVTDTGPGIPRPDRERVFDRFTRLEGTYPGGVSGSGLGLAIARGIAHAHAGSLTCADPADSGSGGARLVLRLPQSGPQRRPAAPTVTAPGTFRARRRSRSRSPRWPGR